MKGGMMPMPLTVPALLDRAAALFGDKEVVTSAEGGPTVRRSWRETAARARRLEAALAGLGVRRGDRVASLAWNHNRHVELYFGVPAAGAVLLTVNARLAPAQVARILEHAGAEVLFTDPELVPLVDAATRDRAGPKRRVVLAEEAPPGWDAYEALLAAADPGPGTALEEDDAAGLCYTSGTTGEPKGVLYSHRAIALHTLAICLPDAFGLGERDVVLPAVPMFHANAWGLVHAAAMTGATLVLPGPRPSAEHLARLLGEEGVTFAAGVPTVWMGVLEALRRRPPPPSSDVRLRAGAATHAPGLSAVLRIHVGGAPTAPALLEAYRAELGVEILTGWGMTELTPVGMVTHPRADMEAWTPEALLPVRTSQGTPLPFVEARVVDDAGEPVPHDGRTPGELEVRGPWVCAEYFRAETADGHRDGWLRTGDVATMDARGYVRLVDRTKDLIRSGGEWISSVQLEHALLDHPAVAEAAVVAVPDARWHERPCACVVLRAGEAEDAGALLAPLAERFPTWWVPDRVIFVDAIPRTATGKFDKRALRERLGTPAG
jgi:fatty-acyl-CoA synthase